MMNSNLHFDDFSSWSMPIALLSPARRALVGALFLAVGLVALSPAEAETVPKPDSTTNMAKVLEPGPLPELSTGDAAGDPVIEYGSVTYSHCAEFSRIKWPGQTSR